MKTFKEKLRYIIDLFNPCNMGDTIQQVNNSITKLETRFEKMNERFVKIESSLDTNIETIKEDLEFYKNMIDVIGDTIPDMLWLKDTNGVYHYANTEIRKNLLMCDDPLGHDDLYLSSKAKAHYGNDNHTFGEVCGNSDLIVLKNLKPQRFLESGKVRGKMMYLEVFKAPFYVDDKLFGVCGSGRDMTEYVEAFRKHNCSGCSQMKDIFSKYEFGANDEQ